MRFILNGNVGSSDPASRQVMLWDDTLGVIVSVPYLTGGAWLHLSVGDNAIVNCASAYEGATRYWLGVVVRTATNEINRDPLPGERVKARSRGEHEVVAVNGNEVVCRHATGKVAKVPLKDCKRLDVHLAILGVNIAGCLCCERQWERMKSAWTYLPRQLWREPFRSILFQLAKIGLDRPSAREERLLPGLALADALAEAGHEDFSVHIRNFFLHG